MADLKKRTGPILANDTAPPFSLPASTEGIVALDDFGWSPVVLLFYVADFNPLCIRQLTLFNEILPELYNLGAQVLGIATDTIWSHIAFAQQYNLHFPLLSDFEPKGDVARAYHVYNQKQGHSNRAVYVISKNSKIAWANMPQPPTVPDASTVLKILESSV